MWVPKNGYDWNGFCHWFCKHTITGMERGSYNSYDDAEEACRVLNGS